MIKSKILFSAVPFMALGTMFSLTACSKKYDLVIYNWEDYIFEGSKDADGTVKAFEKYYSEIAGKKISVAYETFSTNEDMYKQLKLGSIKPDLICPSDYMIQKMANEGMLLAFSYDESTNTYAESLKNWDEYGSPYIREKFAGEKLKDGSSFLKYAVPYFWGTMGFTYDAEYMEAHPEIEIDSWECLWSEAAAAQGKIFTLKDSVRDSYVAAIFHVYKDEIAALDKSASDYNAKLSAIFNRSDAETIKLVEAALKDAKAKTVRGFEVDEGKNDIVTDKELKANLAWSGDSVFSMDSAEGKRTLNYSLPKEGSNVWFDGWCMPKNARQDIAEAFVNFICSPEKAAECMDAVGYTSPIVGKEMWELVNDWYAAEEGEEADEVDLSFYFGDSIEGAAKISIAKENRGRQFDAQYPTEEVLKNCCVMKDFGDDQTAIDEMWVRVSAA